MPDDRNRIQYQLLVTSGGLDTLLRSNGFFPTEDARLTLTATLQNAGALWVEEVVKDFVSTTASSN
jgi:hypothetical protein